jgi:phosphoglycerate kinase
LFFGEAMLDKKSITDIDIANKKVLVRVDFNVPISEGIINDDTRIKAALPTINYLLNHNASVILCSHLGRPKGEVAEKYSLMPISKHLSKLLDRPVHFANDCLSEDAKLISENLSGGEVLLLENTRFHAGEKKNDPEMAKRLASYAEVFINDAFGTAHRAHASNVGVASYLPSAAGFLLTEEIQYLGNTIANAENPFVAIIGGAKVSDKIGVIKALLEKADAVLIGGGMANTFFMAQGYKMADSLVEENSLEIAKELLNSNSDNLHLPIDLVIADSFSKDANYKTIPLGDVPNGWRVLDVGEKTVQSFKKLILEAKTIVWNGPMGVFEFPAFAKGTNGIAVAVAESEAISIIGGGDSVSAINKAGLETQITHISTGGGASLEMLEGKILPGISSLSEFQF